MKLIIINNPQEYLQEAEEFFSASFCDNLLENKPGTYIESLVARFIIEKNKKSHETEDIYYNFSSISHKTNLVFIGISEENIGVDIENLKKRDANLLNKFSDLEYSILGKNNWKNFYTLWTAKESIIKYENLLLDDISSIILVEVGSIKKYIQESEDLNYLIENNFTKKLILKFENKTFVVYSGVEKDITFSVCVSHEIG